VKCGAGGVWQWREKVTKWCDDVKETEGTVGIDFCI